jgi:hypothetical protein
MKSILRILFNAIFAFVRHRPPVAEPQAHELFDAVLGRCEVCMPVSEKTVCGEIRCWANIEGRNCEFVSSFSNGPEINKAIDHSLKQLRIFYQLGTNHEHLKLCKNSLFEAMPFHRAICPTVSLSECELKSEARLICVRVIDDDRASFRFSNPVFMAGRTISMHVGSDGSVSFVGVP